VIPALVGLAFLSSIAFAQTESASTIIAASDIGGRSVIAQGFADASRRRVDRTIVTPFDPARRIIVRPDGMESAATPRAPAPAPARNIRPAAAIAAASPPATDRFVSIGSLDLSAPPPTQSVPPPGIVATEPFVAAPGAFVHIGSYDGLSTISPD